MENNFSDYIVYCDESGDHNLESIDLKYPLFVLAFCIFNKASYSDNLVPSFKKLKFFYFGHDTIIFHEHEIRKAKKSFKILINAELRFNFMENINQLIESAEFTVVAAVIKKKLLKSKYSVPNNPYHLALKFGLERIFSFLKLHNQHNKITHIIAECRGEKEDLELKSEFDKICLGKNRWGKLPFQLIFADKKTNSCGLQVADLIAHPIGRQSLNPKQKNRAFNIIETKFYKDKDRKIEGRGLKHFP